MVFSAFGSASPTRPQFRHSLPKCFFADFLFTFQLAYIPNLDPFGSRPVYFILCANLQFSAILDQFLPRAPRCAALRCNFTFQIFYTLYFILLARILDTLELSRLDFCPVPACSFLPSYTQCSPSFQCPDSTTFSFLQWMSDSPWLPYLLGLPVPLCGPCLCCPRSMAPTPGPAPRRHAHHAPPAARPSRATHCCSLLFAALPPFSISSLCFFSKASVDLKLLLFGVLQLFCFRLFGLRGSVEI